MVFAPASALHSWRSSVCSFVVPPHSHPGAILHFVRHLRGQPGLILLLWSPLMLRPNTKALRRSGGAFATPVFIPGNHIRKRRGSRPHRPGWHGAGMALLASSAHRFALHSRGSARQELCRTKTGAALQLSQPPGSA